MKLVCPSCGTGVPAADINIQQGMAKCGRCDSVFRIDEQLPPTKATERRGEAPIPKRFRIDDLGTELIISWSWFTPVVIFLMLFCIVWDGFLVAWYAAIFGIGFFGGNNGPGAGPALLMGLFPILHVAVGVGLTYFVLASFVNRTTVRVDRSDLTVRHGPLPFPGNKRLNASEIRQLYCTQATNQHRNGIGISYELNAVGIDGIKSTLLKGLTEAEEALFLEQRIERFLGIADERVPGELRT